MQEKQENSLLSENLTLLFATILAVLWCYFTRLFFAGIVLWLVFLGIWFIRLLEFIEEMNALAELKERRDLYEVPDYDKRFEKKDKKKKKEIEDVREDETDWEYVRTKK